MKTGMTLESLWETVKHQRDNARDLLADTVSSAQLVAMPDFPNGVALVLLPEDGQLERYSISENAHQQIAGWLNIPRKYYARLLADHLDLLMHQVNALFKREPGTRLVRTLDGTVRAFLSDRYRTIDNDQILRAALPPLLMGRTDKGELPKSEVIGCHLGDNYMRVRAVWTDPALRITVQETEDGPDTVSPGFEIGNSETGRGGFYINGFTHRSFCRNGMVFGRENMLALRRTHVGGRLVTDGGLQVFSEQTQALEDKVLLSQVSDLMHAMASPEYIERMTQVMRTAANSAPIEHSRAGVEVLAKTVGLQEAETELVLENLIRDRNPTRWGAANAITRVANEDAVTEERSLELQKIGGDVLSLTSALWTRIANAKPERALVPVAASA